MTVHIFGIDLIDHDKLEAIKAAAGAAGHDVITSEKSAVAALWDEAKEKFPDLVADGKKLIADFKDKAMSGGDKAVAIAEDLLTTAPDVIKAIPNAKDFLVHGVTELYAAGIDGLEKAAADLLGKL